MLTAGMHTITQSALIGKRQSIGCQPHIPEQARANNPCPTPHTAPLSARPLSALYSNSDSLSLHAFPGHPSVQGRPGHWQRAGMLTPLGPTLTQPTHRCAPIKAAVVQKSQQQLLHGSSPSAPALRHTHAGMHNNQHRSAVQPAAAPATRPAAHSGQASSGRRRFRGPGHPRSRGRPIVLHQNTPHAAKKITRPAPQQAASRSLLSLRPLTWPS